MAKKPKSKSGEREQRPITKAVKVFRKRGGLLRTGEVLEAGVHPRTLYQMRSLGLVEPLARGLYRLADMPPLEEPDFVTVAQRIPQGVICLISALTLHELTTQIPHAVQLALPRSARYPVLEYPPLQVYRYTTATFKAGVEEREVDGVTIRLYCAEKTLADCFKHRNKLGLDVALEALHKYRARRGTQPQKILEYARISRVEKVMRPYLEASA